MSAELVTMLVLLKTAPVPGIAGPNEMVGPAKLKVVEDGGAAEGPGATGLLTIVAAGAAGADAMSAVEAESSVLVDPEELSGWLTMGTANVCSHSMSVGASA